MTPNLKKRRWCQAISRALSVGVVRREDLGTHSTDSHCAPPPFQDDGNGNAAAAQISLCLVVTTEWSGEIACVRSPTDIESHVQPDTFVEHALFPTTLPAANSDVHIVRLATLAMRTPTEAQLVVLNHQSRAIGRPHEDRCFRTHVPKATSGRQPEQRTS